MSTESQLREKLRKIEALFAGAGTAGERLAAEAALDRVRVRRHRMLRRILMSAVWGEAAQPPTSPNRSDSAGDFFAWRGSHPYAMWHLSAAIRIRYFGS
jgi:hypothetical protein